MICSSGPAAPVGQYKGTDTDNPRFSNWSGDVHFNPAMLRKPEDLKSLVEVVAEATELGQSIHPYGSGWAFEDCAKADGVMVSLEKLNTQLNYGRVKRRPHRLLAKRAALRADRCGALRGRRPSSRPDRDSGRCRHCVAHSRRITRTNTRWRNLHVRARRRLDTAPVSRSGACYPYGDRGRSGSLDRVGHQPVDAIRSRKRRAVGRTAVQRNERHPRRSRLRGRSGRVRTLRRDLFGRD